MSTRDDLVICSPLRTPVGRYGGALRAVTAAELASGLVRELVARGLDPERVDDVILGHCTPTAEAPAIGRVVAVDAGLGLRVPGMQVDRRCGSGLQAVLNAAQAVRAGMSELIIAGGTESMSQAPYYSLDTRWGARFGSVALVDSLSRARETPGGADHPSPGGMVETAENVREEFGITREAQDAYAARSHRRAVAAIEAGAFADELVPVRIADRRGETVVDRDEHPRADTTETALAELRPVLAGRPGATVTAGNASGQNDGAAACVVTTRGHAERLGLEPTLVLRSAAVVGLAPERMGLGPAGAAPSALERAGIGWADLDLIELNEAFAAQVLACCAALGLSPDDERLNPLGSGISLGHPLGATGVRILATMSAELRRRQGRYALETMCIGGGQGLAAVFERA